VGTIKSNDLLTQEAWNTIIEKCGNNRQRLRQTHPINNYEKTVFSQNGEDGVIEHIFQQIGFTNKVCVEFGACDGMRISNTRFLKEEYDFRRILIEGGGYDKWPNSTDGEKLVRALITPDNINTILADENCPQTYDFLSVDIDGDDYWVWKAMTMRARVVIVEYQPSIPNDVPLTIIPSQTDIKSHLVACGTDWNYRNSEETAKPNQFILNGYYGANLRAFYNLATTKGYKFCTTIMDNAIFVLNEEFSKLGIPEVSRQDCIAKYNCPIEYWWKNRDHNNREWIILDE